MEDAAVPWGHQVAVMFQIVSVLALEGLAFLRGIAELRVMSPDVQLSCERWGHMDHTGAGCECCSSDRTGAYVHSLSLMPRGSLPAAEDEDALVYAGGSDDRESHILQRNAGGPGSCPLCPIDQVLMAISCSRCMYDGRRACWWPLIGCGP